MATHRSLVEDLAKILTWPTSENGFDLDRRVFSPLRIKAQWSHVFMTWHNCQHTKMLQVVSFSTLLRFLVWLWIRAFSSIFFLPLPQIPRTKKISTRHQQSLKGQWLKEHMLFIVMNVVILEMPSRLEAGGQPQPGKRRRIQQRLHRTMFVLGEDFNFCSVGSTVGKVSILEEISHRLHLKWIAVRKLYWVSQARGSIHLVYRTRSWRQVR